MREDYTHYSKGYCEKCGSQNNLVTYFYDDGTTSYHCFTPNCSNHMNSEGNQQAVGRDDYKPVDLRGYQLLNFDIEKRGLLGSSLAKFGVLYNESEAVFPYYKEPDHALSAKVRRKDKTFWTLGNHKEPWLYGQWIGDFQPEKRKVLIITEGEMDAIAAYQLTGWASVSISKGADGAVKDIKNNLKWIEKFDKVYICFDSDEPGRRASQAVMEVIMAGKAYDVRLTHGKDANDYCLLDNGKDLFITDLNNARKRETDSLLSDDFLLESTLRELERREIEDEGFSTGFDVLDPVWKIRPNEVTAIFSDPSVGKSSLVRQISANWVVNNTSNILYFALEESAQTYNLKIAEMLSDGDLANTREYLQKFKGRIISANVFGFDLTRIREAITYAVRAKDVKLVILDNITAICSSVGDYTENAGKLYSLLVALGKEFGHHTIVLSHTRRDTSLKAGSPPSITAAYGSGAIERFSDNVISLGREEGADETWVAIRKQRDNGKVGELTQPLRYDRSKKSFTGLHWSQPKVEEIEANGSKKEEGAGENQSTSQTPRQSEAVRQSRIPDRRSENGEVRQQNGAENSSRSGGLFRQGSKSQQNKQQKKAVRREYSDHALLQSRFCRDDAFWQNYLDRSEREHQRHGQAEAPKLTPISQRATFVGSYKGFPHVAPPNKDELLPMGREVRDAMLQRG